jgi:GNAT superfamily N-acetyltransferase
MSPTDFPSIVKLTAEEHWGYGTRDLRRMLTLEPKGCLVAALDNHPVGLTTAISYGRKLGWIGNVVVHREYRRAGIGSRLVESAIRHLLRSRVDSIGLNSYPENVRMYERLNFKAVDGFVRLSIRRRTGTGPHESQTIPFADILRLDRHVFGADRSRLLRRLLREFPEGWSWVAEGSKVLGYSLVKQYDDSSEIGPMVCIEMNADTISTLLGSSIVLARESPIEIAVPRSNRIVLEMAARLGFRIVRKGYVMSHGDQDSIAISPGVGAFGFLDKG